MVSNSLREPEHNNSHSNRFLIQIEIQMRNLETKIHLSKDETFYVELQYVSHA